MVHIPFQTGLILKKLCPCRNGSEPGFGRPCKALARVRGSWRLRVRVPSGTFCILLEAILIALVEFLLFEVEKSKNPRDRNGDVEKSTEVLIWTGVFDQSRLKYTSHHENGRTLGR